MYISATNQTNLTFPLQIRRRLTPWPWNKGRSAIHRPPLGSALKSLAVPRSDFLPLPPGQPLRKKIYYVVRACAPKFLILTYISLEDSTGSGQVQQQVPRRTRKGLRVALAQTLHHRHGEQRRVSRGQVVPSPPCCGSAKRVGRIVVGRPGPPQMVAGRIDHDGWVTYVRTYM